MADNIRVIADKSDIDAIADAVRNKNGTTGEMGLGDIVTGINSLVTDVNTYDATAVASSLLSGETAYVKGEKITGTMANNGAVSQTLTTSTTSYTVPAGYHNGSGSVKINTQTKSVTPSTSAQTVTPDTGYLLSKVTVAASTGKTVYTGTYTLAAGTYTGSYSLDIGVTIATNDKIYGLVALSTAYEDNTLQFCQSGGGSYLLRGFYKGSNGFFGNIGGSNAQYQLYGPYAMKCTTSGTTITFTFSNQYLTMTTNNAVTYQWALIKA